MITLNLTPKQVNAMLVAMDSEIDYTFEMGGKPDWESFPEIAVLLTAYYNVRCKLEENQDA